MIGCFFKWANYADVTQPFALRSVHDLSHPAKSSHHHPVLPLARHITPIPFDLTARQRFLCSQPYVMQRCCASYVGVRVCSLCEESSLEKHLICLSARLRSRSADESAKLCAYRVLGSWERALPSIAALTLGGRVSARCFTSMASCPQLLLPCSSRDADMQLHDTP